MSSHRSGFQSLEINGFTADFTESECFIFDLLKGFANFTDQLSFPISYPEFEVSVRFHGGAIRGVGEGCSSLSFSHIVDGFARPSNQLVQLFLIFGSNPGLLFSTS